MNATADIFKITFAALRRMDAEADTVRDGNVTGLSWYAGYARPELKRPSSEPEWSKRLATLLCESGFPATAEVRYPVAGSRQKCDVVASLPSSGRLWLEIKGAWKHWWLQNGGEWFYHTYLFHPLLPGLDESKSHTAALDVTKLGAITREHGTHIGLLLIGFDGEVPMEPDVREFVRLAKLDDETWSEAMDAWPDQHRPGETVRCWLWIRKIEK